MLLFEATLLADGSLERISAASASILNKTGAGESSGPLVSTNGRFVLYSSSTPSLTSNLLNDRVLNLFLRDRESGSLTLVSRNAEGRSGSSHSIPGGITPDARFVVFESASTNLVANDTNGYTDIFLRDIDGGTTSLISVTGAGSSSGNSASTQSRITPDGKYVVFQSDASNLVANDTNRQTDIFLRDVQNGTTEIVSVSALTNVITTCSYPVITPNGRYVTFIGSGSNLVAESVSSTEIYIRDRVQQATIWASVKALSLLAPDAPAGSHADSYNQSISDDGRYVFFKSSFSGVTAIFRFEVATGETVMLGNGAYFPVFTQDDSGPSISKDGKFAVFAGLTNLYRWDSASGSLSSIASAAATYSNGSWWSEPQITGGGNWIVFAGKNQTDFENLTNGWQVFLADASAKTSRKLTSGSVGSSSLPQICFSNDGAWIAYDSSDGSLFDGDNNETLDVFFEPLPNGPRELISSVESGKGATQPGSLALNLNEVSADGRFVLYSTVRQMSSLDTNRAQDIYVRDLDVRTNRLVTVRSEGGAPDLFAALGGHISSNGNRVVFVSRSANFVANDTNGVEDIFVRDVAANTTIPVSVNPAGTAMGNGASTQATISPDGRFVAFQSLATDLVTNIDRNNKPDIFVRDLAANTTTLVSVGSSGEAAGGTEASGSPGGITGSTGPLISVGGRYVLFDSTNNSLTLRDLVLNRSTNLAKLTGGFPLGRFSSDGTRVILSSSSSRKDYAVELPSLSASVLYSHPGNLLQDTVFCGDGMSEVIFSFTNLSFISLISSNVTTIAETLPPSGITQISYPSPRVTVDDTGRFIAYSNIPFRKSFDLQTNSFSDIFLFDTLTGVNSLLSRVSDPANGASITPMISANGRIVAFQSGALNLSIDKSTIGSDIYVYRISNVQSGVFRVSILESLSRADFIISWESEPGARYRVEFKPALEYPDWSTLASDLIATDTVSTAVDPNGSPQRYYRVEKIP